MRTNFDPEEANALLEDMLRDEQWQAASAAIKAEALSILRTRRTKRILTRLGGVLAVIAFLGVSAGHWLRRQETDQRQIAALPRSNPNAVEKLRPLTDAELVGAFPEGSCFIAEVDGKKELIFFDREVERTCVAKSGVRGD